MSLFDEAQSKEIAAAVTAVESTTAGELVVVHTARSDDYALRRGMVSFLVALAAIELTHEMVDMLAITWLLAGQLLLVALLYIALGWGPLLRLITPSQVRAERSMQRAVRALVEEGVTETRDRSGVLIFLSEAERRVVILADKGINERVESGEWDRDVALLVDSLKKGKATEGVLQVVQRIGALLSEAFPRRSEDINELSDAPRRVT